MCDFNGEFENLSHHFVTNDQDGRNRDRSK